MKIEAYEKNGFQVTLESEDLERFHIDLHRDGYGSQSLEHLFSLLTKRLEQERGFNPDHHAVAIRAIPLNAEQLILRFTTFPYTADLDASVIHFTDISPLDKELGTYARPADEEGEEEEETDFTSGTYDRDPAETALDADIASADLSSFNAQPASVSGSDPSQSAALAVTLPSFQEAANAAACCPPAAADLTSLLFRMDELAPPVYVLFIMENAPAKEKISPTALIKTFSEFGETESCSPARLEYYKEHGHCLIKAHAIAQLQRFQ